MSTPASGSEAAKLRDLAIMLWPTDDCNGYNAALQAEGFPKPTTVMKGEDGKPRLRPDKTIDTRYLAPKSCRFCSVFAANPRNKISRAGFTEAQLSGGHNPKRCSNSLAELLKRPHGTHFIEDRSRGRYK